MVKQNVINKKRASTPSFKDKAYKQIKDAILFNRFRVGAVYSQESICNELKISLTPLREALLELQKDGYVTYYRGRGVLITPVSKEDANHILEARLYIERTTAYLAATRATEENINEMKNWLDSLHEKLETRDGQNLYRLDHGFHRAIAKACGNPLLYHFCDVILDQYLRFEVKSVYNNSIDSQKVLKEHMKIFREISMHNAKKAENAMETHLNNSYKRTLSQFWNIDNK